MKTNALGKHSVGIAAVASISLLVIAGNRDSPSLWFVLPSWFILVACVVAWIRSLAKDNPFKDAFAIVGAALLFYCVLWEALFNDFLKLVFEPSPSHLLHFAFSRQFLVLLVIYLVAACRYYAIQFREQQHKHDSVVAAYKSRIEELRNESARTGQDRTTG